MSGKTPFRIRAVLAAAAGVALALSGCGGSSDASDTPAATAGGKGTVTTPTAQEDVRVILDFVFSDGFGPLAYGQQKGYFAQHGVNLKVTPGRGGELAMQQINARKVDFAFTDLSVYLAQRLRGETDTTAVYSWINVPQTCIASLSPINSPKDMEGKSFTTVGFSSGKTTVPYVLKKNGVDTSKVKVRIADISTLMSQLLSGATDTIESAQFGSLESNSLVAEKAGKKLYCTPLSDWGHRDYGKLLVVRNDLIKEKPDLVKRTVAAFAQSLTTANQLASGDDIAKALQKVDPQISAVQASRAWDSQKSTLKDLGPIQEQDVIYLLDFLKETANLSTTEAPASFFDNSFVPSS